MSEMNLNELAMKKINEYNICYIIQEDRFAFFRPQWMINYTICREEDEELELESIEFMSTKQMNLMLGFLVGAGASFNKDWVKEAQTEGFIVLTLQDYKWHLAAIKDESF